MTRFICITRHETRAGLRCQRLASREQTQKGVSVRRVEALCVCSREDAGSSPLTQFIRLGGRVLRRGKTLVKCDVDVLTPDGEAVAKAIATYKVG